MPPNPNDPAPAIQKRILVFWVLDQLTSGVQPNENGSRLGVVYSRLKAAKKWKDVIKAAEDLKDIFPGSFQRFTIEDFIRAMELMPPPNRCPGTTAPPPPPIDDPYCPYCDEWISEQDWEDHIEDHYGRYWEYRE